MMSRTDPQFPVAEHCIHGSQDSVITGILNGPDPPPSLLRVR